ncbi:MAG: tetratricopeptide repeat protein, partial [Planctomycetota bacterium]|jgi:Tfp pilus assembly protein PilF
MRIPRPDLSLLLGTPNACTQCHDDQSDQWAAYAMEQWYGADRRSEPHGLNLLAPDNGVCVRCHLAEHFDTPSHHFHSMDEAGSDCSDCHMPERTYMVVDPRRDHSMRIPRPDLSLLLGTPNACTQCHDDQSDQWAADAMEQWYGADRRSEPHFGRAIAAAQAGQPGADLALAELAASSEQPGIARATAISLLVRYPGPGALAAVAEALRDADPLVRLAALQALEGAPPQDRWRLAASLLEDPVRAVRTRAARVLAVVPDAAMSPEQLASMRLATDEMIAGELANAERVEAHVNLGSFYARRERLERARSAYETALRLDPDSITAHVNLADLYRQFDRDDLAEPVLRDGVRRQPEAAAVHHALGLLLVRTDRLDDAVESLGQAARLEPGNSRFAYVYAIALDSAGDTVQALAELEDAHRRHPADREILVALIAFNRDADRLDAARLYAERLVELSPRNPEARRLLESLGPNR